MSRYMKEPCEHCPYRKDVRPFLRPERGAELARTARLPFGSFHCHKTLGHDDETDESVITSRSLLCAGFLALQAAETGWSAPEGIEGAGLVYGSAEEMVEAYRREEV